MTPIGFTIGLIPQFVNHINKIYKKYVPDINRKVMDIYAKYKTDKKLDKQISMAVGYIKLNNPIVAYSAPENVSNRILIDITDRYL